MQNQEFSLLDFVEREGCFLAFCEMVRDRCYLDLVSSRNSDRIYEGIFGDLRLEYAERNLMPLYFLIERGLEVKSSPGIAMHLRDDDVIGSSISRLPNAKKIDDWTYMSCGVQINVSDGTIEAISVVIL